MRACVYVKFSRKKISFVVIEYSMDKLYVSTVDSASDCDSVVLAALAVVERRSVVCQLLHRVIVRS